MTPKCPNHNCPLVDLQYTGKGEGIGVCPVSTCEFEFQSDYVEGEGKKKIDKFGRVISAHKYRQMDGGSGG